eukprot:6192288-Pleurochrysis_carterae.AAC.2
MRRPHLAPVELQPAQAPVCPVCALWPDLCRLQIVKPLNERADQPRRQRAVDRLQLRTPNSADATRRLALREDVVRLLRARRSVVEYLQGIIKWDGLQRYSTHELVKGWGCLKVRHSAASSIKSAVDCALVYGALSPGRSIQA